MNRIWYMCMLPALAIYLAGGLGFADGPPSPGTVRPQATLTDSELEYIFVGGSAGSACEQDKCCTDINCNMDGESLICYTFTVCKPVSDQSKHCANDKNVVASKLIKYRSSGEIRCATILSECQSLTMGCAGMPKLQHMPVCGAG